VVKFRPHVISVVGSVGFEEETSVPILEPSSLPRPVISLVGATRVGACSRFFVLDGGRSTGLGGRPGQWVWELTEPSDALFLDVLRTQSGYRLQLPVTYFEVNREYQFRVNVTNFFGVSSSASHSVRLLWFFFFFYGDLCFFRCLGVLRESLQLCCQFL